MSETFERLKEAIALVKEKKPAYAEILDFYEVIWGAQDKARAALKVQPPEVREDLKKIKIQEGFPLLKKEDFQVDLAASRKLFVAILGLGKKAPSKLKKEMKKIKQAASSKGLDIEAVLTKYLDEKFLEDTAKKLQIDYPALSFLARMSVEPSIEANASQLGGVVTFENWQKGYCPICGSHPRIGELKKDVGKRYVLCSFCGYQWRIQRIVCPFCGNNDPKTLRYLFTEGEEWYRLDVCDQCHRYLKTVDSRKINYEPILVLEDLVTFHLDILAAKEGFQRLAPVPWGT